jgi:methyl-accepting chemotaxis protein
VSEIVTASQQQRQGIEQVAMGVSEMEKTTQAGAAGAEESAASAEELNGLATTVQDLVDNLRLMVGAASEAPATTQAGATAEARSEMRRAA